MSDDILKNEYYIVTLHLFVDINLSFMYKTFSHTGILNYL